MSELDHEPGAAVPGAVKLADALASVVRTLGQRPGDGRGGVRDGRGGAGTVSVLRCWEEIVGASVAAHARPTGVDDGRLLVVVDHPGWATQLRFLSTTILERLAEAVGSDVVDSIEVRVSSR